MATATIPRETIEAPDGAVQAGVVAAIEVNKIIVAPNVREQVGDVSELAESIRQHGVLQPVCVRYNATHWILVYGQRRLAAAKLAGLERIPAIIEPAGAGEKDTWTRQLVENLQRQDLNPLEEARAFRAILDSDKQLTQAEFAKRIGRSAPYVSNALRILELDVKVLPLVKSGQLSGAHAKALASLEVMVQREVAAWAVENEKSAHDLEDHVKWYRDQAKERAKAEKQAAKAADEAEAKLGELGATKDAVTLVSGGYYGRALSELLKKRGWKFHTGYGYKRGKTCDCEAYEVAQTWDGRLNAVKRTCISAEHAAQQRKEEDEAWAAKQKRDAEKAKAEAAELERRLAPFAEYLVANASTGAAQRLTLFALVSQDYGTRVRFTGRHHISVGYEKPMDQLWGGIVKIPAAKLADEIGRVIADHILHLYKAPGVLAAVAKIPELADVMAPAKPAKAKKAGR